MTYFFSVAALVRVRAARVLTNAATIGGSRLLHPKHHPFGILDALLDADEEADGIFAVNEAVIVGQGEVHHGPDHDLVIDGDRPFLDRVHAEDGALRRVDQGGREERAEYAAVGDRERPALQVSDA